MRVMVLQTCELHEAHTQLMGLAALLGGELAARALNV